MHKFVLAVAVASIAMIASLAHADTLYRVGSDSSLSLGGSDPGLKVFGAIDVLGYDFYLNNGQSETFAFFDVWTDEASGDLDDVFIPHPASATLSFEIPVADAVFSGSTRFSFIVQRGILDFAQNSQTITADDGRVFSVSVNDVKFKLGGQTSTVYATVTQCQEPTPEPQPIPLPASVWSGLVLGGAIVARRVCKR